MKKINALTIGAAILALTGCTANQAQTNNKMFDQTGVVTTETSKASVKKLYRDGVETTEELETIDEEVESTDEEVVDEEEVTTGELVEETPAEETEEKADISSYHVEYSYEYATKASIANRVIIDSWEKEEYSLTYVLEDEELFLDMSLKHSFQRNEYCKGSEEVHAIYQDGRLYVTNTYTFGEFEITDKDSYRIKRNFLYYEFGDFFRQTYLDLLFVDGDKEGSYNLLDVLLDKENVEIVDADERTVSIKFDYDEFEVTIVFDTTLNTITGATFDHSKALMERYSDIVITDKRKENNHHNKDVEQVEDVEGEVPAEEENLFKLEEAKEIIKVNFSYNDQAVNKLTEEEIAEYHNHHGYGEYGHHNDHSYYDDDDNGHHGHHGHGGHDSEDWDEDRPDEDDDYYWDWDD